MPPLVVETVRPWKRRARTLTLPEMLLARIRTSPPLSRVIDPEIELASMRPPRLHSRMSPETVRYFWSPTRLIASMEPLIVS